MFVTTFLSNQVVEKSYNDIINNQPVNLTNPNQDITEVTANLSVVPTALIIAAIIACVIGAVRKLRSRHKPNGDDSREP